VVEEALAVGYRHIDTAAAYRNEKGVGEAIVASGLPREDVFVTTKLWNAEQGFDSTLRAFDASLKRLGFGYVDLYLIHWPVPFRSGRGWQELEALKERGLARAIGVSNYGDERLARVVERAGSPPSVNQVLFSPYHYRRALLEACDRLGVVLEAYSPLERGRALDDPTVTEIAVRLGRSPAQVLLRWGVQHGAIVIPKSSRRERIRSNAEIFDFELGEPDMDLLDSLDRTGGTGRAR
jgi:diketogulonate reductase-like aldo/keto reductase